MKVSDVFNYIDSLAPFETAAKWDNSGLLAGDFSSEVTKALICLDVTKNEIEYAKNNGINLIISHHPVIFSPLRNVLSDSVVYEAVKNKISIITHKVFILNFIFCNFCIVFSKRFYVFI